MNDTRPNSNSPAVDPLETAPADDEPDQCTIQAQLDVEADDAPEPAWLQAKLAAVVDQLQLGRAELTVVVIDDATMQRMHEQFSGIAGTTDVLTFDLSETTDPAGKDPKQTTDIEGEVYVCLDEARRQAVERIHPIERELLLYAVHGLLHLIGYDDHDPQQHRRMHELEDQLLEAIGVGATFGPVDGEQPERNEQAEA